MGHLSQWTFVLFPALKEKILPLTSGLSQNWALLHLLGKQTNAIDDVNLQRFLFLSPIKFN